MTRIIVRVALFALLTSQAACIAIPLGKRSPTLPANRDPESPASRGTTRRETPEFGPKPVVGKQPPSLLVARDGTQCAVSEDKFERTIIGTSVWCVWSSAGE